MTSLSQSSTLLGVLPPPSLALLREEVSFIQNLTIIITGGENYGSAVMPQVVMRYNNCVHYHSFPLLQVTVAESTSCGCDNTSAIIGGVVIVAFMITTSLTIIVVVILVLISRRGNYSAKTRHDHTLLH